MAKQFNQYTQECKECVYLIINRSTRKHQCILGKCHANCKEKILRSGNNAGKES